MAWLARLDQRSHTWPAPGRWLYRALKWGLVALGAFALGSVILDRIGVWPL